MEYRVSVEVTQLKLYQFEGKEKLLWDDGLRTDGQLRQSLLGLGV